MSLTTAAKQAVTGLLAVVCVALIARVWVVQHIPPDSSCQSAPPLRGPADPLVILALLIASAATGWALGGWRKANRADDEGEGPGGAATHAAEASASRRRTVAMVQLGLCAFLAVVTAGLAYEAWSLVPDRCRWPLTYYVRWTTKSDPLVALPVAAVLTFLMGRWLWYPRSQP
jgi:hypothetical protein